MLPAKTLISAEFLTEVAAAISDFNSYYESNLSLTDIKTAQNLFVPDWPIYTKTNDSCPAQYFETGTAKNSVVSNGCLIEGEIDHSVIGRGCIIKKGAVVKNCIVLSDAYIGEKCSRRESGN